MTSIRHLVFLKLKTPIDRKELVMVFAGLQELVAILDGASSFVASENVSPENLDKGFLNGFSIDFASKEALNAYLEDKTHQALGARLVGLCKDGLDGLMVFDQEV